MGGFTSLEIGKRALLAQRFGLDTTSNNIANINTPGYSRRTLILTESQPQVTTAGLLGTGVLASRIDRVHEDFFDKEIRNNASRKNGFSTDTQVVDRIEATFNESSDFGLDSSIKSFFSAFEDLSLRPESLDKRSAVLSSAQTMIEQFHSIGQGLQSLREDTKGRIGDDVTQVNGILKDIAEFNHQITLAKAQGNDEVATFLDQRNVSLEKLSNLVNVQVSTDTNGLANVSIGGSSVVTGSTAATLAANETINGVSGERTINVVQVDASNNVIQTLNPVSGELASLVKHYNVTLDGNDSSGGFSVVGELNSLADAVTDQVNNLTVTGFGLNDAGAVPPGRNFFVPSTVAAPATALSIALDPAVDGIPSDIPAADVSGQPGNNVIARQIGSLITNQTFINNATPVEFYSSTLSKVGTLGADAQNGEKTTSLIADQLFSQQEAVSGVNLDEEAVNLIKYQKAFEAAARIISTTNDLMGIVVNLGK